VYVRSVAVETCDINELRWTDVPLLSWIQIEQECDHRLYWQSILITISKIERPAASEVRSVIRFLNARGPSAAEIHRQICDVYGTAIMSDSMVRRWVRFFNEGREMFTMKNDLADHPLSQMTLCRQSIRRSGRIAGMRMVLGGSCRIALRGAPHHERMRYSGAPHRKRLRKRHGSNKKYTQPQKKRITS